MKTFLALLACTVLTASAADLSVVGEQQEEKRPSSPLEAKWTVQVEVLMVALPEEMALKFLPDLRDPDIVEAAVGRMMKVVEEQNAVFFGNPLVETLDGTRCVTEAMLEKRYPIEFQLPERAASPPVTGTAKQDQVRPVPTSFETRNVGVILEVEPQVKPDGKSIVLNLVAQRVAYEGEETYEGMPAKDGQIAAINQPRFANYKVTTTTAVPSGSYQLIAVNKLTDPRSHVKFFILRATAIPLK